MVPEGFVPTTRPTEPPTAQLSNALSTSGWRMAGIEDGMSNTGDAPYMKMKEGPGPRARDPDRRAPARLDLRSRPVMYV